MVFNKTTTISFPGSSISPITTGIVNGSLVVREILCMDKIAFGDINSNQFQCQLYDCPDLTGKKIQVTQTDNDTSTTTPIFVGWVDSCKTDDLSGFKTIVAYDYFYTSRRKKIKKWWKNFWSSRKSATIGTIWRNLFSYYNISYVDTTLLCDGLTVKKTSKTTKLKVTKFNDFLSQVCELNLCIPNVNRSGSIEFIKLYERDDTIYTDIRGDYVIKNSQFEDYAIPPYDKVVLYDQDSDIKSEAGEGDNVLTIQNNLFLFNKKQNWMNDLSHMLLSDMHTFDYIPAQIEMKVSNLDLHLGDLVQTTKGLSLISENNLSGPLLVDQSLYSNEKEDGTEVQSGKASLGEQVLGVSVQRDLDRLDYKIDVNTPDLTLAKLDDGRVAIRDPKLVDEEGGTVTRQLYVADYNFAWAPAQGIWRMVVTGYYGSFLICNIDNGVPYVTVNDIARNWGYPIVIIRVPAGESVPTINFTMDVCENVWNNNYHPEYTAPYFSTPMNPSQSYRGTKDGYDYYGWNPCGIGSTTPQIAYEYTTPDYTAVDENTMWNDLIYTDKIKWPGVETGDSIFPSATAQDKVNAAAGTLAKKVAGQSGTVTPTGAFSGVNVASDGGMEQLAANLNAVNDALDGNTRVISATGSAGTDGLKATSYGGTDTTLLAANPSGEATQQLTKLQINSTVYEIEGGGAEAIELTQAEYNQLTPEEKADPDKVYYIKDAGGGGGGGGASALEDLVDVDIDSSLADGDVLVYNATSGKWENGEGGGSGGGSSYKRDTLFESTTDVATFDLSHPYTDYDAIIVTIKYSGSTAGTYYATGYFTTDQLTNDSGSYGIATDDWYVYFNVASTTSFTKNTSRYSFVCKIEGLKFGGGGGSEFVDDVIYENTTGVSGASQQITITKAVSNYDAFAVVYSTYNDGGYATRAESYYSPAYVRSSNDFQCVWYPTYGNRYMTMTGDPESTTVTLTTGVYGEGSGYTPIVYEVHGIKYGGGSGGGGTNVEANPQDTPTDTLETIKIGNTVYDIAGSAGGGGKFKDETLYENTGSSNPSTITLSEDYTEFDMIVIKYTRSSQEGDYTWHNTYLVNALPINSAIELTGWQPSSQYAHYTFTDETTLTIYNQGSGVLIREIHGLKLNGSGSCVSEIMPFTSADDTTSRTFTFDRTPKRITATWNSSDNWIGNWNFIWGDSHALYIAQTKSVQTYGDYAGISSITYGADGKSFTITGGNSFGAMNGSGGSGQLYVEYGEGGNSETIYSTTEQVIGTWIDGKPLYQTTLSLTSSSGNADQQVSLSTYGISNIETVCKIEGTALATLGYVALNYFASSNDCFNIYMTSNNTVMVLAHYGSWTLSIPVYVTLQYTKTTD